MSTEVGNANSETFHSEPKIYISKATLKLNINSSDYAWRTDVKTPQQTTPAEDFLPEAEVAKKHVSNANVGVVAASSAEVAAATAATAAGLHHQHQQQQHKLPTFQPTSKPIKMKIAVSDFMHAERCHTENIENMNPFDTKM